MSPVQPTFNYRQECFYTRTRDTLQKKHLSTRAYSLFTYHHKIVADQTVGLMIVLCKTQQVIRGIGLTSWVRSDNISSLWTQSTAKFQTPQEQQQQLVRNTYTYKISPFSITFMFTCMPCQHQSAPEAILQPLYLRSYLEKGESPLSSGPPFLKPKPPLSCFLPSAMSTRSDRSPKSC